jgi:voltage-gated potassium channel
MTTARPNASVGLRALVERALLEPSSASYRHTLGVILGSILVSIVALTLETVHPLHEENLTTFELVDHVLLLIFTVEYLSNIWVAPNRREYMFGVWGFIDLVSIAPSFLALLAGNGASGAILPGVQIGFLRELRILRVLRMLKLMKLASERASESTATARDRNTFWLDFQIYLICLFTVVIISATVIFHIEQYPPDAPPIAEAVKQLIDGTVPATATWMDDPIILLYRDRADKGWPLPTWTFDSVPMALWWGFVTLTTTGYGDMYPVTGWGRVVGALTMLSGLALFSLLTSVVGRTLMRSLFGRRSNGDPAAIQRAANVRLLIGQVRALLPGDGRATPVAPVGRTSIDAFAGFGAAARGIVDEVVRQTGGVEDLRMTSKRRSTDLSRLLHAAFVDEGTALYAWVRRIVTALILASIGVVILNSVTEIHEHWASTFDAFEAAMVVAFTLEYLSYVYLADQKRDYVFGFWGIVDLLAILPTYVTLVIAITSSFGLPVDFSHGVAFKIIRILRVLRMLRILKLMKGAVSNAKGTLSGANTTFWMDLQIYLIALLTVLTMSSTLVYTLEVDVPGTQFINVPVAMWWAIVTITTTGYGDMFPVTILGRIVGMATMIAGLALFGILTSVIGRSLMSSLFGSSNVGEEDPGAVGPEVDMPLEQALLVVQSLSDSDANRAPLT